VCVYVYMCMCMYMCVCERINLLFSVSRSYMATRAAFR
jgi:hypothetical protein